MVFLLPEMIVKPCREPNPDRTENGTMTGTTEREKPLQPDMGMDKKKRPKGFSPGDKTIRTYEGFFEGGSGNKKRSPEIPWRFLLRRTSTSGKGDRLPEVVIKNTNLSEEKQPRGKNKKNLGV